MVQDPPARDEQSCYVKPKKGWEVKRMTFASVLCLVVAGYTIPIVWTLILILKSVQRQKIREACSRLSGEIIEYINPGSNNGVIGVRGETAGFLLQMYWHGKIVMYAVIEGRLCDVTPIHDHLQPGFAVPYSGNTPPSSLQIVVEIGQIKKIDLQTSRRSRRRIGMTNG